jgi:hypothetical protein
LDVFFSLAIALGVAILASAQPAPAPEQPPAPAPAYKFLSGTIIEVRPDSLVVRRSLLGRPAQTRTFRLTPDTKIEGDLKVKARVTVGYMTGEDGDVAARVIVRSPAKKQTSHRRPAIGRASASRAVS